MIPPLASHPTGPITNQNPPAKSGPRRLHKLPGQPPHRSHHQKSPSPTRCSGDRPVIPPLASHPTDPTDPITNQNPPAKSGPRRLHKLPGQPPHRPHRPHHQPEVPKPSQVPGDCTSPPGQPPHRPHRPHHQPEIPKPSQGPRRLHKPPWPATPQTPSPTRIPKPSQVPGDCTSPPGQPPHRPHRPHHQPESPSQVRSQEIAQAPLASHLTGPITNRKAPTKSGPGGCTAPWPATSQAPSPTRASQAGTSVQEAPPWLRHSPHHQPSRKAPAKPSVQGVLGGGADGPCLGWVLWLQRDGSGTMLATASTASAPMVPVDITNSAGTAPLPEGQGGGALAGLDRLGRGDPREGNRENTEQRPGMGCSPAVGRSGGEGCLVGRRPVLDGETAVFPGGISSHKSQVTSHKSQVTSHKSQVTSHKSQVTSHKSQVTSHKSQVTSHKSQVYWFTHLPGEGRPASSQDFTGESRSAGSPAHTPSWASKSASSLPSWGECA